MSLFMTLLNDSGLLRGYCGFESHVGLLPLVVIITRSQYSRRSTEQQCLTVSQYKSVVQIVLYTEQILTTKRSLFCLRIKFVYVFPTLKNQSMSQRKRIFRVCPMRTVSSACTALDFLIFCYNHLYCQLCI